MRSVKKVLKFLTVCINGVLSLITFGTVEILGSGRMRIGVRVGSVVCKIPYNITGMHACIAEQRLWRDVRSPAMAPILFSIPGVLVVLPYYSKKFTGKRPDEFIAQLNAFGIKDLHPYNIRYTDADEPIAIDYAVSVMGYSPTVLPGSTSRDTPRPITTGWGNHGRAISTADVESDRRYWEEKNKKDKRQGAPLCGEECEELTFEQQDAIIWHRHEETHGHHITQ